MNSFINAAASAVLGLALSTSTVQAAIGTYSLPSDAIALSPIEGSIAAVAPLCPDGVTCFVNGTIIDLRFVLQGCMDQLGPVTYRAEEVGGKLKVYVSAINVHSEESTHVMCFAAATADYRITLINQYGDVEVYFLGFNGGSISPAVTPRPAN